MLLYALIVQNLDRTDLQELQDQLSRYGMRSLSYLVLEHRRACDLDKTGFCQP